MLAQGGPVRGPDANDNTALYIFTSNCSSNPAAVDIGRSGSVLNSCAETNCADLQA